MPVWEYKVISSGKGGFATPAHLEAFLNQLGMDEWEIIHFQPQPDNLLAFTGVARRPTQRDWTLEDAAAAAARVEADRLRAEFEAKFKGMAVGAAPDEEKPESAAAEQAAGDDGLRRLRDTESDLDPDAPEESAEAEEWDELGKEEELPTFFEAIQPLMRRNQRGAGMSAGVDHLAKKWGMSEADVLGALKECGLTIPEDEDDPPAYVEYDGDLFWVNVNHRGEYWINTKEKARPRFRTVQGTKVAPEEEESKAEGGSRPEAGAGAEARTAPALPAGPALLEAIHPKMRSHRGGGGASGSVGFLSRALKCRAEDLTAGFAALGLALAGDSGEAQPVEIAGRLWWLKKDNRGGVWINERPLKTEAGESGEASASGAIEGGDTGRDGPQGRPGLLQGTAEPADAPATRPSPPSADAPPQDSAPAQAFVGTPSDPILAALRLLLKPTRTGAVAGEMGRLARTLEKGPEDLLSTLSNLGFKVPEKPREKPAFVENAGEIFWLNRNAKGELWLNAKAASRLARQPEPKE